MCALTFSLALLADSAHSRTILTKIICQNDQVVGVLYSYVCMHLKAMELKYIRQGLTDQHFISRFQALVD